jgi:aryl-phospho-beta-D-glucosidase BglC (GH1 family)
MMKNILMNKNTITALFFVCFLVANLVAQPPQKLSYQAVIRNTGNELVANSQINLQVSILKGSAGGPVVYYETHTPFTDANGVMNIEIGGGTKSWWRPKFSEINWSGDSYFIKTEVELPAGTGNTITGTSQILSVPYALHSHTADRVLGTFSETDPVFEASVAGGISGTDISGWKNKQDVLNPGKGITISDNIIGFNAAAFQKKPVVKGPGWPDYPLRGANIVTRITQEDVDFFVNDWGGNSVRLLVNNLAPAPPAKPDPQRLEAVYRTIDMCLDAGLYTVLSFSPSFEDNDAFFSSEEYMNSYIDVWKEIVTRYANDRRGVGWDLMNEPHDKLANTHWLPYAKRLVSAIREIDTIHTIIVEPPGWGWPYGFEHLLPIDDDNIVYSFHFYGPMDFTHQRNNGMLKATEEQWLSRKYPGILQGEYWDKNTMRRHVQPAFDWAKKHKVKMWCGEFGCTRWAVGAEQWIHDMISILEEEEIGWSWYAFREWYAMDIEMDPDARLERTDRYETELVKYFKQLFKLE